MDDILKLGLRLEEFASLIFTRSYNLLSGKVRVETKEVYLSKDYYEGKHHIIRELPIPLVIQMENVARSGKEKLRSTLPYLLREDKEKLISYLRICTPFLAFEQLHSGDMVTFESLKQATKQDVIGARLGSGLEEWLSQASNTRLEVCKALSNAIHVRDFKRYNISGSSKQYQELSSEDKCLLEPMSDDLLYNGIMTLDDWSKLMSAQKSVEYHTSANSNNADKIDGSDNSN